jgi:hypothetical protein
MKKANGIRPRNEEGAGLMIFKNAVDYFKKDK